MTPTSGPENCSNQSQFFLALNFYRCGLGELALNQHHMLGAAARTRAQINFRIPAVIAFDFTTTPRDCGLWEVIILHLHLNPPSVLGRIRPAIRNKIWTDFY